ncbi:MAG: helix-turn-helix domain-containing protein [Candidatus Goldbacteria bacterium]|nr:helix-turn-helix domain-containing protein [Candidatus Goldiibacteriota bacterium]
MSGEILTIKDLALMLKVKPVTIYKLAGKGRIPGVKIAGSWRFKKSIIDEWMESPERKPVSRTEKINKELIPA